MKHSFRKVSVSSHNATSTHLPVIVALLHSCAQISFGPPRCLFSQVFGGRGRQCNWNHVISQHATSPVLSLIKSYCPRSLCHPLCCCCVCMSVFMCIDIRLCMQLCEVSCCSFPVTDLKTKGCHCGGTT